MATQPFKPSGPDSPTGRIPRTIGLAGGTGKMGMMFKRLFEADGQTVLVAGRSTSLTFEELARRSDVVIVSVPISHTGEVIQRIAPLLNPDQLFSDFTSIKSAPVAAMLKSAAQVVGCHPIFGPMGQPEGQNVVLCPARPGDLAPWYREFFTRHGMRVHEMTPAEHDEAMGVIQGLTHFINIAFAKTLETRGVDLQRILNVCSPVYRVTFAMLSRILSGDPALYSQIQMANRESLPVIREFLKNGLQMIQAVEQQDAAGLDRIFRQSADFLGDYKTVARMESDLLIERMTDHVRNPRGESPLDE